MPLLLLLLGLFGFQRPPTPPAPPPPAAASSLDYEFFKTRVQPIFLAKRPGHARCITCHETGQPRLATLEDGATSFTEEQSRQNFAAWQRVVVPGDPDASRLLTHPLAKSAGGDPFHAGGRHWQSKSDPEFQTLVAWVKTGASPTAAQSTANDGLSFDVYRTTIEPIFLKERAAGEGAGMCASCHSRISTRLRLQPLAEGAKAWTEAQSRQNFEAVKRVVIAGDPAKSALAVHPLAPAAGGDPQHTGGKFWTTQDNPEYQAVVAWVKAATPAAGVDAASSTPALDFAFFRTRVEPIFLAKRPGHARCITCHETGQPRLGDARRRRDQLHGSAVAAELRRVAAGGGAGRSGCQPSADAPVVEGGGRRPVPRRRPALAVEVAIRNGRRLPPGFAVRRLRVHRGNDHHAYIHPSSCALRGGCCRARVRVAHRAGQDRPDHPDQCRRRQRPCDRPGDQQGHRHDRGHRSSARGRRRRPTGAASTSPTSRSGSSR